MHRFTRLAALAAFATLLAACGGGGSSSSVPAAAPIQPAGSLTMLSSTLARGDDGSIVRVHPTRDIFRAGGGSSQPHPFVSNLNWGGGPVQHTPKIYIIYWGWTSDPSGVANYMQGFFNGTGGSQWQSSQTQYHDGSGNVGNQSGELAGTWTDLTNPLPRRISQSSLAAEAVRAIAHFGNGSYSVSTNYIVASPHGKSMSGFGTQWCAWHSSTGSSHGTVSYTYMPYMPDAGGNCGAGSVNSPGTLDGVTIVGGHEQAETMTDPQPSSGWVDSSGAETGDKCAWINLQNTSFSTGTYPTQPLWSNSAGGCVQ